MLVLGLDVGGTASRALVTTVDGARVGFGRAGAGNPFAVALPTAIHEVSTAVRSALSDVDPASIGSVVIGLAGSGKPYVSDAFADALAALGITAPVQVVGDVVVAFAAGTAAPHGTVLISGTGAIAARIVDDTLIQTADGLGWLLGDLGSGFWLGRAAGAHAARELYSGPPGLLTRLVTAALLTPAAPSGEAAQEGDAAWKGDAARIEEAAAEKREAVRKGEAWPSRAAADELIAAVHARPPQALARLAPLVSEAAQAGEKAALEIIEAAAAHLVDSVAEVHAGGPVVLAGSVLRHSVLVREAVTEGLERRWPGAEFCLAEAGEVGAARLAVKNLG